MAQTEKPAADILKELYDLQQIDSKIDQIEVLKGELPMEVADLEDELAGLDTRIGRLEGQVKDVQGEIAKHTANIEEAHALIARYTQQMDNVKNNREYEALMKETELQNLEIQLSNKKISTLKKELEAKQETLQATRERRESKAKDLDVKHIELQQIIEKTEKEEKSLRKHSEKARKNIEERLLRSYDRIRGTYRNGLAVVTVERDSCGGCFNHIPPQQQLEIAQRKKILACEHCGRILVDNYVAVEEEAA